MGLYFGWRTAVLFCAMLVVAPIAAGLLQTVFNRSANRTLALLLMTLLGVMTPWMIGFAGFYDRWPWLTFLPVALPLFVPALTWLYGHALVYGRWPARGRLALVPGAIHFVVMLGGFFLPLTAKLAFAARIGPALSAVVAVLLISGFGAALVLLARLFRVYAAWLSEQRSDDTRFATRWLARALAALALLFAVWSGFELVDLIRPLDYDGLMPLYLGIAATTVFLAVEGWRHAALPWPAMPGVASAPEPPLPTAAGHDWAALGTRWQQELQSSGTYRESDLSLARAARLLGTNTAYLSRACNEGLGVSFSTLVNRMRADAVAQALREQPDEGLLDLALEAGFASKASFNRAFAERFGATPSAFRRGLRS